MMMSTSLACAAYNSPCGLAGSPPHLLGVAVGAHLGLHGDSQELRAHRLDLLGDLGRASKAHDRAEIGRTDGSEPGDPGTDDEGSLAGGILPAAVT